MKIGPTRTIIAALAIALTTIAAQAQDTGGQNVPGQGLSGGGRRQHHDKADKNTVQKPKVDEKAYDAALKSLPDKPSDPWHGVR
jgi:hypothetical protein